MGVQASGKYNTAVAALSKELSEHLTEQFQNDGKSATNRKGFFAWNAGAGIWGFIFLVIIGFVLVITLGKSLTFMLGAMMTVVFVLTLIMQYIFFKIMPAYTKEGRKILDEILGFKMYLKTAEERRFDALNPPEKTLALFEKYLPYAIALECQSQWSDKFESILEKALATENYRPTYYSGNFRNGMSFSTISNGISAGLSSTIASASTAPSSSSGGGSSGGGSSGGGGGGGGGGGW